VSRLKLSTKGKTLEDLMGVIVSAKVLPVFRFTVGDFNGNDDIVSQVQASFEEDTLIVRSSAKNEDCSDVSNAGHYRTVTDVKRGDAADISAAIKSVIASYDDVNELDEVLIQPMLTEIRLSGVAFTADIDTLAPYYVINYDSSGSADSITSGSGENSRTYVHFKESPLECDDPLLARVCSACRELESIFDNPFLDIEFAFDADDELYILQCRPIAVVNKEDLSKIDLKNMLARLYGRIEKLSSSYPGLLGEKALFGVMPDWNPAEIIGFKPRQLALSLYKELVTDNVWAYQRDNYGYKNLRSHPLMVSFLGVPYIDVRVDFNSFIPKSLDKRIAKKLFRYYIEKLESTPSHHDKVEFEVIHSCYYLNLPERLKDLRAHGFNDNEIKRVEIALLDITNDVINVDRGLFRKDLDKIELLKGKYDEVVNSSLTTVEKIYWLVEDCKRYGTLPFAGIARAAFMGVQFLRSLMDEGVMSHEEYDGFMGSLSTVATKLNNSLSRLLSGQLSREEFMAEYGHLRPNTYDILSWRYDEHFEYYFSSIEREYVEPVEYEFRPDQIEKINIALIENGLRINASGLINFIKEAIEGREYAKFIFTRSLSEVLRLIGCFGENAEISRDDLSHANIRTVLNMYSSLEPDGASEILNADIRKNKLNYEYTKALRLPSFIRRPHDVYSFFLDCEEPTFVTLKRVETGLVLEDEFNDMSLQGKVVFIKSADPGYDYLFTKNISGLVTQFGGANSHMAIRCAEVGIPAVIGAGEKNFSEWSRGKIIEIDCMNKQVRVIA